MIALSPGHAYGVALLALAAVVLVRAVRLVGERDADGGEIAAAFSIAGASGFAGIFILFILALETTAP